jgi:hypothetical protein
MVNNNTPKTAKQAFENQMYILDKIYKSSQNSIPTQVRLDFRPRFQGKFVSFWMKTSYLKSHYPHIYNGPKF